MLKNKCEYRVLAKETRKKLDIKEISQVIINKIKEIEGYKNASKIAAFYPYDAEIDIKPLFNDVSKQWALPVVIDSEKMIFCKFNNSSKLGLNRYGISEPLLEEEINPIELDMIIVPALFADKNGNRLGYGKGYYDRFLKKLSKNCVKLVPIAHELLIDELPADEYDVKVDIVVTQNEVLSI